MSRLAEFLSERWFSVSLLGVSLALVAALGLMRRRKVRSFTPLLVLGAASAVAGVGGLALSPRWGGWVLVSAVVLFVCLFLVLALTGAWRPSLGYGVAFLALLGAGAEDLPDEVLLERFTSRREEAAHDIHYRGPGARLSAHPGA